MVSNDVDDLQKNAIRKPYHPFHPQIKPLWRDPEPDGKCVVPENLGRAMKSPCLDGRHLMRPLGALSTVRRSIGDVNNRPGALER